MISIAVKVLVSLLVLAVIAYFVFAFGLLDFDSLMNSLGLAEEPPKDSAVIIGDITSGSIKADTINGSILGGDGIEIDILNGDIRGGENIEVDVLYGDITNGTDVEVGAMVGDVEGGENIHIGTLIGEDKTNSTTIIIERIIETERIISDFCD